MKINNEKLQEDIAQGRPLKLNLGSGYDRRGNFYCLDHLPLEGVDIVADLNKPLVKLPDNSVEYIYSRHVLEHIDQLLPLLDEIYRVTKTDGTIEIIVPHFSNPYYYSDPTHVRSFGLYSMHYFVSSDKQTQFRKVPSFYSETRFLIKEIYIDFYRYSIVDKIIFPFISKVINLNIQMQDFYERRLCNWVHASQIRYVLTVDKDVVSD